MSTGPSLAGRAFLALSLTVAFYAIALGLVAGIGWMIYESFTGGTRVHGRLLIGGGITIAVILWSVMPRIDRFPDPGVRLREAEQPDLFREIADVAAAADQGMPAEVFLVADVNAFVAQRGGLMGIGSRRVMGIGLPLLQVLTVSQFRAVIAHEFGHFHGGDTRLGPWIYRTRSAIVRTVSNFAKFGSWLQIPFHWYAKMFLRITQAISRRQELAADALSVRIAGSQPMCTALGVVSETAPLYPYYLNNEFLGMLNGGVRPPLADGFGRFLASPGVQQVRQSIGAEAREARADPYDTHPPLGERLAAAAALPRTGADGGADSGALAITLIADLPRRERDLVAFLVGDPKVGQLPGVDWATGPHQVLPKVWCAVTFDHSAKLPDLRVADAVAQREHLDELARCLGDDDGESREQQVAWLIGALLGFRLTGEGFRVHAEPGHPIELRRGDASVFPFDLLDPSAEGALDDSGWRRWCEENAVAELPLAGAGARPSTRSG